MASEYPPGTSLTAAGARRRALILRRLRDFFDRRGLVEVETPVLSRGISTDCHIDVFSSRFLRSAPNPERGETVYLQTSPELLMKRLLCRGYADIYQICKVFRNGERGRLHNPEFTMLEWYRKNFTMQDLMDETAQVCQWVLGEVETEKRSYRDVFHGATGTDPLTATDEELRECARRRYASLPQGLEERGDILNFIMSECVEPQLDAHRLCFVFDFPSCLAALAAIDPRDERISKRFELYYQSMELCNGFEELAAAQHNRGRMESDNDSRRRCDKETLPVDERFLQALEQADGLGHCSGAAMGVDRLVMAATGSRRIDSVLTFGWEEA